MKNFARAGKHFPLRTFLSSLVPAKFLFAKRINTFRFLSIAILLLSFSLSYSQTFVGVSSVPADNGAQAGVTTATITPPGGMQAGDLVIIFAENRATGATLTIPGANSGGQTWNTTTANSGSNLTTRIFWGTFNGTWTAPNPTVTGGTAGVPLSAIMYVFRPSNANTLWNIHIGPNNNTTIGTNPNVITGVSTTAAHTVTMAFWNSAIANQWGTLAGAGWLNTGLSAQYRNTTGSTQSHSAAYYIQTTTTGATGNVSLNETSGAITATRTSIISWVETPANDLCANATSLSSATTCVNTTASVVNASYTGPLVDCFGATPTYDVWYSFIAQTTNPKISVNIGASGSNINLGKMQMFSGACGALTAMTPCATYDMTLTNPGTTNINATGLTVGNTYYIRIYSSNAVPTSNGTFTICITDPVPPNDDCGGAVTLPTGATCTNTGGTAISATLSSGIPLPGGCGTPAYDVWYKFVATSPVQSVNLSNPTAPASGTNFFTGNTGIQILANACGSLSTVTCSSGTSLTASGLTIGNTYYVRVYSTVAAPTSSGAFNICVTDLPANDDCSNAISITSNQTCTTTNGTLINSTFTAITGLACGVGRPDVWYSFVAQATNPVVTVGGLVGANGRFQVFSGTCGTLSSVFCSASASATVAGLTVGTTYYVRVYSTAASTTFTVCVDDPVPANDNCAQAINLTSATTCNNITSSMYGASLSAGAITADCAGAVTYDTWFKFVAQATNPTITLSSLGVDFTNPGMELLSACGGTAIMCGTTSLATNYLTPGTTYFIRVYSTSATAPTSFNGGKFDICVVDPAATPPFNDNCINAINLPIWNTCNNVAGSVAGATPSTAPGLTAPCAGAVTYDVWYKFTAATNNASVITLSGLGTNFTSSGIQIFSGSCGSLTSIACNTGTTVTTPALTTGTVYYIRVFSTAATVPNGNARFNICATTTNAPVRFGNSYVNLSKKTAGGVIMPGDTLEIRFTVNHTSGTMTALRFVDNTPTHTNMLATANDSIRIITNEGLTFKRYTPSGADADPAVYKASPGVGEFNLRLNVGFASGAIPGKPTNNTNSAVSANGQMNAASDRPRGGGGMLFAIAYRVKVSGVAGDTVTLFPGQFIYNNGVTDVTLSATPFNILISNPLNLCANSVGLNNAVENGGTFGAGTTLNRSYDLTTPIAGYTFMPDVSAYNAVGDGRYAIVKNMSPRSDPVRTARRVPNCNSPATLPINDPLNCNNRMHGGHWDIDGDHTGTSNAIGNVPPDDSTAGGYMLEVNADYVASEVYRQTVNNLCPNTYYEFSAWVRNICKTCGIDSAGQQFTNSVAGVPAPPPNGYPGVLPNLTFTLNDLDYYNTGEIDTVGWLKKGFVFKTGPFQTTATFSIRNNAQGGGGNDWTLDDIAIATCLPTMNYSPSITPAICEGNSLQINDTVRSYFNNYTYYKWQRSTDGGANWNNITLTTNGTLTNNGSIYQFITSYTIPSAHTTLADSGDLYRVIVATKDSNLLNSACLFTDASTIITLKVNDCGVPLAIDFISFNGKKDHGNADLIWITSKEDEPVLYFVDRSTDGTHFSSIATIPGNKNPNAQTNTYKFTDANVPGKVWYRIAMMNKDGQKKYTRIIMLDDGTADFGLTNVINPFSNKLDFEISTTESSRIDASLINMSGKPVKKLSFNVYQGMNSLSIPNTESLPAGMYILQIQNKDQVINKKVIKK